MINGKYYVGKTKRGLLQRWNEHINPDPKGMFPIHYAIKKYGVENFKLEVILYASSKEQLDQAEKLWIISLDSCNPEVGYNMRYGGNDGTFPLLTRQKMAAGHTGKKHSLATRKAIADSHTGRHQTPEHTENNRKARIGKYKYITNGVDNKLISTSVLIPECWYAGRTLSKETRFKIGATKRAQHKPAWNKGLTGYHQKQEPKLVSVICAYCAKERKVNHCHVSKYCSTECYHKGRVGKSRKKNQKQEEILCS